MENRAREHRVLTEIVAMIASGMVASCTCSDNRAASQNRLGATVEGDSIRFALFAPGKRSVELIGDVTEWQAETMQNSGDTFVITKPKPATEYTAYQYIVDGEKCIADPYSNIILDPDNDWLLPSSNWSRGQIPPYPTGHTNGHVTLKELWAKPYRWRSEGYERPEATSMTIYELNIRDFRNSGSETDKTFADVTRSMGYFRSLGVNAVMLMGIAEFRDNDTWGEDSTYPFAIDKVYGNGTDLRVLIDSLHANGIAVILSMSLDRMGNESPLVTMYSDANGRPLKTNPWFNRDENFGQGFSKTDKRWSSDLNHESRCTKTLTDSIVRYWSTEFRIDGICIENGRGMSNTQHRTTTSDALGEEYDENRIANIKRIAATIEETNSEMIVLCDDGADEREESELAKAGIMMITNMFNEMSDNIRGNANDLTALDYKARGWWEPRVVGCIERQGMKRIGETALKEGITARDKYRREAGAAAILLSVPGAKLIRQYQEWAYDWEVPADSAQRAGGIMPHTPYADSLTSMPDRRMVFEVYQKMCHLRQARPIFSTKDYEISLKDGLKNIILRRDEETIITLANFDNESHSYHLEHTPSGEWRDVLSNKRYLTTSSGKDIILEPGDYVVLLND